MSETETTYTEGIVMTLVKDPENMGFGEKRESCYDIADLVNGDSGKPEKVRKINMEEDGRIYEYTSAANPNMSEIPVLVHPPELHQEGATRIIPFDLRHKLSVEYPATSPNLMASYLRILPNESLNTKAVATSQAFYVIRLQLLRHFSHPSASLALPSFPHSFLLLWYVIRYS